MFQPASRYYNLETATLTTPDGKEIVYKRRRFVPPSARMTILADVRVNEGDRLDQITAAALRDPEHFWRVADANDAMNPFGLTAEPGRTLRIPLPEA